MTRLAGLSVLHEAAPSPSGCSGGRRNAGRADCSVVMPTPSSGRPRAVPPWRHARALLRTPGCVTHQEVPGLLGIQ
ncbi:hypothetical protein GCM10010196_34430 [Agromyces mediolanus]|uniref:Uncharacterized protein n=1 Tax=Agromyces mediolanus TaxID=41986 RepID=A0A918KWJ7_AGRME|nr:hypothetical protein GCM10010196_34430 [Agromyces mediolanus]